MASPEFSRETWGVHSGLCLVFDLGVMVVELGEEMTLGW